MANKIRTSFSLSAECLEQLKKLAVKNKRSKANMVEIVIAEASKRKVG